MADINDLIDKIKDSITKKLSAYKDTGAATDWLKANLDPVRKLFEDKKLRDFIFEPFQGVFKTPPASIDKDIYSVITQVAIINAVLAGLPGKMGVGVYVSIALEGWMAYSIARHVGLKIENPVDVFKYFSVLAGIIGTILVLFKQLLGFAYSLVSLVIPGINPLIIAELIVTDMVGILFLVGFAEAKASGSFKVPKRVLLNVATATFELVKHQMNLIVGVLSLENIKIVGQRLIAYLSGELAVNVKEYNGDIFTTATMLYLVQGKHDKLQGPLGEKFIEATRLRWSDQFNADTSIQEIASHFEQYDPQQLIAATNTIKGKMFELIVAETENSDSDSWQATLHTDESFPGSDIIFTNSETGQRAEVSLKAISEENPHIIEAALAKYPDTPIPDH